MATRRIGELLVAEGLLSEAAVNRALGFQRLSGERIKLGSILLNWDLLQESDLLQMLAKLYHCPAVTWPMLQAANVELVRLLPAAHAIRLAAIPYEADKGSIRVAFLNPTDLLAMDDISAITGRRHVIPGVTTEVRLLQAHQRFYGRHIPLDFRTILQKLERSTERRRGTDWQLGREAHGAEVQAASDPSAVSESVSRTPLNTPLPRRPVPPLSISIPVKPEIPDGDLVAAPSPIPPIEVPDTLLPKKPEPAGQGPAERPASPGPRVPQSRPAARSAELVSTDSLSEWLGDALSAFRGDRVTDSNGRPVAPIAKETPESEVRRPTSLRKPFDSVPSSAHARPATDPFPPRASAGPPPSQPGPPSQREDLVSGMWRSSSLDEHPDPKVSRMWTPSNGEPESPVWEARTRDEIGDAVLQNFPAEIPRVILLGVGRSMINGWRGRGPGLLPEQVAAIRFPRAEKSVFATVVESGVPHFGPVEADQWPRVLRALVGAYHPHCAVFPVRVLDGIAAFLYADRLGQPMRYEDFAIIARAAASAVNILSRFLLRRNSGAPVG